MLIFKSWKGSYFLCHTNNFRVTLQQFQLALARKRKIIIRFPNHSSVFNLLWTHYQCNSVLEDLGHYPSQQRVHAECTQKKVQISSLPIHGTPCIALRWWKRKRNGKLAGHVTCRKLKKTIYSVIEECADLKSSSDQELLALALAFHVFCVFDARDIMQRDWACCGTQSMWCHMVVHSLSLLHVEMLQKNLSANLNITNMVIYNYCSVALNFPLRGGTGIWTLILVKN